MLLSDIILFLQATANVSSVTLMSDLPHLCAYATSATMAHMLGGVRSVVVLVYQMHTTAKSALCRRKM